MKKIIISGWRPGLDKIGLTKIIRKYTGIGLAEGKTYTDKILDGEIVVFDLIETNITDFLKELSDVGVVAKISDI